MIKNLVVYFSGFLLLAGLSFPAYAQSTESAEAAVSVVDDGLSEVSPTLTEGIKQEITDDLGSVTDQVQQLDSDTIVGLGAGMISGAVLTDLLGGSGLVTLAGIVAGGVGGMWAADNLF
jgi:uncharacterized protein YcfJ